MFIGKNIFKPHPWLDGGHLQTIVGYYIPGSKKVGATQNHIVRLLDGDAVVFYAERYLQNKKKTAN